MKALDIHIQSVFRTDMIMACAIICICRPIRLSFKKGLNSTDVIRIFEFAPESNLVARVAWGIYVDRVLQKLKVPKQYQEEIKAQIHIRVIRPIDKDQSFNTDIVSFKDIVHTFSPITKNGEKFGECYVKAIQWSSQYLKRVIERRLAQTKTIGFLEQIGYPKFEGITELFVINQHLTRDKPNV